ncbi:MAG: RidA family protein [Chloroflexota bacterium]
MAGTPRVRLVETEQVPAPAAPYSPALMVEAGRLLFIAGQGPVDATGAVVGTGDVRAQTRQAFANVQALVEAAGGTLASLVELTIYLRDIGHRPIVTEVRREVLREPYPATTMVEISRLAFDDWLIEISAVAAI